MLNTQTDKKLTNNPLIVSPYFDNFPESRFAPPTPDFIITETSIIIETEGGNPLIEE